MAPRMARSAVGHSDKSLAHGASSAYIACNSGAERLRGTTENDQRAARPFFCACFTDRRSSRIEQDDRLT
ncbi:hypothetical protein A9Q95_13835 [Rhodobacterales bacterium 59_46_T64]|nr:hypothetical protein A9Q95_13835 [Rhodobacterales bacterium 59_46_T64]